ncbi:eukaryotic translation initiation factor 3 subunit M isoform X2 [Histomonas meleagridis]|uniref:eukaryotic translation initiation factor 3 subunit M isoform X2 n=1 Tax=Histomonas meleagridis TaxID=135588 RepID=UPI00355ABC88|nr:eukaryotic translation initiation factor 3 subunit M isoform X2 [Histomonas meleagridis]KAH0801359.1 eukaryotic translation initiation factor 3 subunit M isoform X2 [Histomonas meleagridis]
MSDETEIIKEQINIARKKSGIPDTPIKDLAFVLQTEIPQYIDKLNPKEFYQWFCPVWQAYEYMYESSSTSSDKYVVSESEWSILVGKIASALTERKDESIEFTHPSLRAMCMSFMMSSLTNHLEAQAYALRMLLLFAIRSNLAKNSDFVHWLLQFMKRHIENTITIKQNRELFIDTCVDFFESVPVFDSLCVISILHFYRSPIFEKHLKKSNAKNEALSNVATKAFNVTLCDDSFFVFEVMRDTKLIYDYLNQQQKDLLQIFVDGNLQQYDKFIEVNKDFISKNNLDQSKLRTKIMVLTFVSIAEDKTEVGFKEIMDQLQISSLELKKLAIHINSTGVASVKIDSASQKILVEQSPSRLFGEKNWKEMSQQISALIASLEKEANSIDKNE